MTSLAVLPAASFALSASIAIGAPRVTIESIDLSWDSFACSVDSTAASSAPLTWMFSVPGCRGLDAGAAGLERDRAGLPG